jgi:hypothetical protein
MRARLQPRDFSTPSLSLVAGRYLTLTRLGKTHFVRDTRRITRRKTNPCSYLGNVSTPVVAWGAGSSAGVASVK